VTTMTKRDARESVSRVRSQQAATEKELVRQVEGKAWRALGYESWAAMLDGEYGGPVVALPTDERREVACRLFREGLTDVEIAATLGVSPATIDRDVRHMRNIGETRIDSLGRNMPRRRRKAEEEPITTQAKPTRPGVTTWSRRVQNISHKVPMDYLSDEEVKELHGAATFLRDYCQGELIKRSKA
jgi:transposase